MAKMLLAAAIIAVIYFMIKGVPKRYVNNSAPRLSLSEAEARATLGVGPEADAAEIRAAHRRLITALHPDKGGSAELTRRINAARDLLLRN